MKKWLAEAVALPLLPLLIVQGKHTRRVTPRLPEAGGDRHGVSGNEVGAARYSLLAIGESPVAGVGVTTQIDAITSQFAGALSTHLARPVAWRAHGKNGIKAFEAITQLVPSIPQQPVDLVLVVFGVNDTTSFHSVTRWKNDFTRLLDAIESRCAPALIVVSGVPDMANFPALPQPLRWVMGLKAQALDAAAQQLAATRKRTCHVPLRVDSHDPGLMAPDGYHPSAKGCAVWAQLLVNAVTHSVPRHLPG